MAYQMKTDKPYYISAQCLMSDGSRLLLGLPRDERHFMNLLWRIMGTTLHFSSAYHPQTDGQSEGSLGNLLRSLVGEHPRLWDTVLPQAEFAYNNSKNRSTGKSPFEVVYGRAPPLILDHASPDLGWPMTTDWVQAALLPFFPFSLAWIGCLLSLWFNLFLHVLSI